MLFSVYGFSQDYTKVAKEKVEDDLVELSTNTNTIIADFVQKKVIKEMDMEIESSGKFYFQSPSKIRWEYLSPYKYLLVLTEKDIQIYDGKKVNNYSVEENPSFSMLNDIICSIMKGEISENNFFYTSFYENDENYKIQLTVKSKSIQSYISHILVYIDKNDKTVKKITIMEPGDDYSVYYFNNIRINETINPSYFTISN